jgi:hypothetical protein
MNETSARYVNAMIRKPNARRNEDLARALSAARDTGSGSTQNLSQIIEAVRQKPSTDGATVAMLNKLMRAKTSGNSNALRRAMKEIEDLKRATPVTNRVNDKQKKIAELEKYVVNKGGKLNTQRRVAFMNDAQKSIKAYKNGTNMYNTAKTRITAAYETAYKANLNNMGPKKAIDALQKTVNTIGNSKIKTSAREKLNVFIQSSASDRDARNAVIKLKKLDEELGKRKVNRVYLNDARDEALKNINSYNIKNGLAKINRRVQEDMKKRGVEFNTMIANDMYKNVPSNVKTTLRNKYVSGKLNSNDVKRGLNNALETSAGVFKGLENKIANLETELENSKLTANERNKLKKERNNLEKEKIRKNGIYKQLREEKLNANKEIANLRNKLQKNKNLSNGEKRALQEQLNNAVKNRDNINNRLGKSEADKMQYMREMSALAENVRKQKVNANKEIANLRNKLQKNKNLSNGEKRALQEQLNNAMKNRDNINNRLGKSEAEKLQYMREMSALAGNVRNITKQKENANAQIATKNEEINKIKQNMAAAGTLSMAQKKKLRENLEKAQEEKDEIEGSLRGFREELKMAKSRLMEERATKNAKIRLLEANATLATQKAQAAETAAVTAQNQLTQAQTNLVQQRANVKRIQQELNEKTNMSEKQRANLEQQLLIERRQVANAQKLTQNAKSNANAAVAESRRLVAEAGKAANEASARAAEAEAQRLAALENKAKANRLKAEANAARKMAENEAAQSREAASKANAKANEISKKLEESNLSRQEMNALIKQKNDLLETRRKEMQNQINAFKTYREQANKIVRSSANREAKQKIRITALESNRNKWQAEFNLAKQSLNVKNANLLKKIDEINKTQSNLARLQKELNNTKTASAAEKNAIKTQLEAEKQNLARQFTQTQTDLKSTKSELIKLTKNRNILFKELQNRSGTLLQTREERNKLKQQLEETKKILRNTQNNLGQLALAEQRTRGQRNTLSRKLANVRGQRQNLRSRNNVSRKVIAGLTQQRQDAQRGINTLRATTRNLERRRLATDRATNKTFNASAAFNRQMKGVAPRQSWQSLKPKATMVGAVQADVLGKRLREKLLKNIDTTNISGKFVINGGPLPGSERRALKKEVQDPMTRLNRLKAIDKMIQNRKSNRNIEISARRRMNQVLDKQGNAFQGFASTGRTGLTNTTRTTGNTRTKLNKTAVADVIRRL